MDQNKESRNQSMPPDTAEGRYYKVYKNTKWGRTVLNMWFRENYIFTSRRKMLGNHYSLQY